ncbi:hypothetical protein ACHAWF_012125 [Thalassiosira exigua]
MPKSKPKFYAVARGRVPGVYATWGECQVQTSGYSGAVFKSFKTQCEANAFMRTNSSSKSSLAPSAAPASSISSGPNRGKKRHLEIDSVATQRKRTINHQKAAGSNKFLLQLIVHFDGGSRGNPGIAGAGAEVILVDSSGTEKSTSTYLVREYCGERATNNYAEYKGLLAGLKQSKLCIEQFASKQPAKSPMEPGSTRPLFNLQVYGDSNLIIQQLKGVWQCKHSNIRPLFEQSRKLTSDLRALDTRCEVLFEHVYRDQNKVADALANEAMDHRRSWITTSKTNDASSNEKGAMSKAGPPAPTKQSSGQSNTSSSVRELIDVDNSDADSHYSC